GVSSMRAVKATDIMVEEIRFGSEDFRYRVPIKFGGVAADRATLLNVHAVVRTVGGKVAQGFGSMPLGNVWSFPSKLLTYEQTLQAMKTLTQRIAQLTSDYKTPGHPIDINHALEPEYLKAAAEVTKALALGEPI